MSVVLIKRIPVSNTRYRPFQVNLFLHSKKFKMNEEVDSFLSDKVSNLLLTCTVDNKSGGFLLRR